MNRVARFALESPGFVGSLLLIESLGYKALEIPCHPVTGMSLEALEMALDQWQVSAVLVVPRLQQSDRLLRAGRE